MEIYWSRRIISITVIIIINIITIIVFIIIIKPHRSTTYIDAAYCYRPSSVVCQSVCLSLVSPAKMAE